MRSLIPVFLLLAASMLAEEKPSAPDTAPPAEDAIAGAKRDFETLKAPHGTSDQPRAGLPAFAPPALPASAPAPLPKKVQSAAELKAEKKSANWLVDAMMKKDEKDEKDSLNPLDKENNLLEKDRIVSKRTEEKEKAADIEKPEREKGPEFNPLTRYMSGWMTPQDYSLLKPGMDGPSAASLVSRGDGAVGGLATELSATTEAGGVGGADLMALSRVAPPAAITSADNPYLQAFAPPTQSAQIFSAPATAVLPTGPASSVFTAPAEPPPSPSRIPDFAKPPADEKYFKQLKRF